MPREMKLVPYNAEWPAMFAREKEMLAGVFGALVLDIHHFGSTAIAGMPAKPTIDVMVVVRDIEAVDARNHAMTGLGYIPRGEHGIAGRRYFVRWDASGTQHASHIHIYAEGHPHIESELLFRDYLRVDPASCHAYAEVKRIASRRFLYSPAEYEDAKRDCVMKILAKARWHYRLAGREP